MMDRKELELLAKSLAKEPILQEQKDGKTVSEDEQNKWVILKNPTISKEEALKMLDCMEPGVITIPEPPVKELKYKKGKPTVIEYKGMRYVLDNR